MAAGFYECGKNYRGSPIGNAGTLWICEQVVQVHQGVESVRVDPKEAGVI